MGVDDSAAIFRFISLMASSKSAWVIWNSPVPPSGSFPCSLRYRLIAAMEAEFAMAASSAPVAPSVFSASFAMSTSLASGFFLV